MTRRDAVIVAGAAAVGAVAMATVATQCEGSQMTAQEAEERCMQLTGMNIEATEIMLARRIQGLSNTFCEIGDEDGWDERFDLWESMERDPSMVSENTLAIFFFEYAGQKEPLLMKFYEQLFSLVDSSNVLKRPRELGETPGYAQAGRTTVQGIGFEAFIVVNKETGEPILGDDDYSGVELRISPDEGSAEQDAYRLEHVIERNRRAEDGGFEVKRVQIREFRGDLPIVRKDPLRELWGSHGPRAQWEIDYYADLGSFVRPDPLRRVTDIAGVPDTVS